MRVGEAEVAAQRSDVANADVRDLALHRRQGRQALEHERRALDLPVGGRRANHQRAVLGADAAELLDPLDVDEVAVGGEPELQQKQQLGAAADDRGILAVPLEQLVGLIRRARAVEIERGQRHAATGSVAFSSPKKSRRPFLLSTRSTASGRQPAHPHFRDLDDRVVERYVRAEQHACLADPLVRLADLGVHRHPGGLEVDVRVAQGDVDRAVDVDDVAVAHVADDDLRLGEADGELLDAPRQGEDRVAAVDQHRLVALDDQLDQRVDGRVVREEAVDQRMQLQPEELGMVEELGRPPRGCRAPAGSPRRAPYRPGIDSTTSRTYALSG